jgi:hypothetical protein
MSNFNEASDFELVTVTCKIGFAPFPRKKKTEHRPHQLFLALTLHISHRMYIYLVTTSSIHTVTSEIGLPPNTRFLPYGTTSECDPLLAKRARLTRMDARWSGLKARKQSRRPRHDNVPSRVLLTNGGARADNYTTAKA